MAIKINLVPEVFNVRTGKWEWATYTIPFYFGAMRPEYYNTLANRGGGIGSLPEETDLGYFTDNCIQRGSNIFGTLTAPDRSVEEFGFTSADFIASDDKTKELHIKYKINEDLYLDVVENIRVKPTNKDNKADIYTNLWLEFRSLLRGDVFTISHMYTFNLGPCTYEEFINLNYGKNPIEYLTRKGYEWGLNSYPYDTESVEESKTTTGCLIQEYLIFNWYDYYGSNSSSGSPFGIWQYGLHIWGIDGDMVHPYSRGVQAVYYVPYILGCGVIPEFPKSMVDNEIGTYDDDSDKGTFPGAPSASAVASNMVRLYQMNSTQLTAFSKFLWNTDLTQLENIINQLKQWFTNPLDSIISLTFSPIDMKFNYETQEPYPPLEDVSIKLGGFDTGVTAYPCKSNYARIPLGEIRLRPYYKSFLDCNPHTKVSIYLPYIGFKELNADVLFDSSDCLIDIEYLVDVITGVCTANIRIRKKSNGTDLQHILYSFSGNVNTTIPISSANMRDFLSATVSATASALAIAGTGGAATPLVASGLAMQQGMNLMSQKVNVSHSGGMALESGAFGLQYAYLVIDRPREARCENYRVDNGVPSEISGMLDSFRGFTQVSTVKVTIDNATDEEKKEIEKLLKEGVIL